MTKTSRAFCRALIQDAAMWIMGLDAATYAVVSSWDLFNPVGSTQMTSLPRAG
jgi:hypothetical protein